MNYVFEGILGVAKYLTQSLQGEDVGLKYALKLINVVSDWEDLVQVDSKLVADFFDLFASYESFATVGEIRVYWRADFKSGSRVLKKVF